MQGIIRQGFVVPMIISIVMLIAFLSYFLKTEYDKEREVIAIENRDDAFVSLFANIKDAGQVEWKTDSLGNDIIVKIESLNDSMFYDSLVHGTVDLFDHRTTAHVVSQTEILQVNETPDSIVTVHEIQTDSFGKLKLRKAYTKEFTFESDTLLNSGMLELHGFLDDIGSGAHLGKDVNPMDVFKRMLPQLGFSLFLLLMVLSAFFMLARSLVKEQQLSHLRNDFIANMTHELKTPVSTVSVALEALSNFDAKDDAHLRKEYLDISRSELSRLDMLVDNALNISLFEKGKIVLEKEICDLSAIVEDTYKRLSFGTDHAGPNFEIEKKGEDFRLSADRIHLTNIIHNLVENGIKYSKDQPWIKLGIEELQDHLVLSVEDRGIGIDPAYKDKVFDKFFRVPQGDKHNVKGYGLGLSYVKQIVEDHNAEIAVESQLGKGTKFIITFPKANS